MGNIKDKDVKEEKKENENITTKNENITIKNEYTKVLFKILTNKRIIEEEEELIKEEYDFFIKIINSLNPSDFIHLIKFFNNVNIQILKIIIKGYILFTYEENEEKNILNIISNIIKYNFNINHFYAIYEDLSILFRNHKKEIIDINSIIKFEKKFKVWKILYSTEKREYSYETTDMSLINFFSFDGEDNKNIVLDFVNEKNYKKHKLKFKFNLMSSEILDLNQYNKKFCFFKLYDNAKREIELNYKDVFVNNDNIFFSNIHKLEFTLKNTSIELIINNEKSKIKLKKEINNNFDFGKVKKLELLNNFIGEVSSISIEENKNDFKYEIFKLDKEINFLFISEKNIEQNLILKEKIFNDKLYIINKENNKIINQIGVSEIKCFGGLECFIPLIKILNYIIIYLGKASMKNQDNIEENLENNEAKDNEKKEEQNLVNNYIKKSLIWVKDIIKIIIKMICLSGNNYKNFLKMIIPLIGGLAEIIQNLNDLKMLSNTDKNMFFNDEVFFILYITIINTNTSNNVKTIFRNLFEVNFNNYDITMDSIIFDINKNNITDLDFYITYLFNIIIYINLYIDTNGTMVNRLIEHLDKLKNEINKQQNQYDKEMAKAMEPIIFFFKNYNSDNIDLLQEFSKFNSEKLKNNKFYPKYMINIIKTFLNAKRELKNEEKDSNKLDFYNKLKNILNFHVFSLEKEEEEGKINIHNFKNQLVVNRFKYYNEDIDFLQKIFPFIKQNDFVLENELLTNEFIDYHGQYHHLMKELFFFNKLWSNKELFFGNEQIQKIQKVKYEIRLKKNLGLKYKIINYYTRNFQRPIIYPVLDYKNRYPSFSNYNINNVKDFYLPDTEYKDDYNFDFESKKLEEHIEEYNEKIKSKITKLENVKIFPNTCFVKQTYHIKGDLFFINNDNNKLLYFLSYPYESQIDLEKKPSCNNGKFQCYGSLFKCSKKESNRIIKIDFDNVRLMIKRIFYYRNSGLEIFTETKSYYFNFFSAEIMQGLFSELKEIFQDKYFPINIGKNLMGFIKVNKNILNKAGYKRYLTKENNFLDFISSYSSKGNKREMCIFDILIMINIISNRSYSDLFQYPVFPLLYFYDNKKINEKLNRDLKKHIGFQTISEKAKQRKEYFNESFTGQKEELLYGRDQDNEEPFYFNTHYSNVVYTSNYLIRLFPYSFCAI